MENEQEQKEKEKTWKEQIKEQVENQIKVIKDQQVQQGNVDYLYKLIDIHKDLEEEENMRGNYGNFDNYGRMGYGRMNNEDTYGRRMRDSRGRYMESGNYGRRGYDTKYRGEEALDGMYEGYGEYMESGNYGGKETMEALQYMLKSAEDFFKHIQQEAKSPEEIEMVKRTAENISRM